MNLEPINLADFDLVELKTTNNCRKNALREIVIKKRRNIQDCKFWKPRGKKTNYCSIDETDPLKRCYGVCKQFCSRDGN